MSKRKGKETSMPVIIERIIEIEHRETNAFIKKQHIRIQELKKIQKDKSMGKKIDKTSIIKELQSAGILDKNGKLASPYCDED